MGLEISLVPKPLNALQKRQMKAWLIAQLEHVELATGTDMPVQNFGLYVNGDIKLVQFGTWVQADLRPFVETGEMRLRIGTVNTRYPPPPKTDRLAILGGVIGVFGMWDDMTAAYSRAIGRTILEAYSSCFLDMVNAPQPAVKLAFSANRSQAAVQYIDDDTWYLNNGEPTKIDDSWHVVAA